MIGTARALGLAFAGFAAGVAAVIACESGTSVGAQTDAGAGGACSACVTGPLDVRVPTCAQWEVYLHASLLWGPTPGPGNPPPAQTMTAFAVPESWEPFALEYDRVLLRRCARWAASPVP